MDTNSLGLSQARFFVAEYNGLPVREIVAVVSEVRDASGEPVEEEVRVPLTEGARGV
jgi:hypothetical protein